MLPLKIAILWHQHQPYYKINGEYRLPWVRLHGIKDYFDLPAMLLDYKELKQTFNLVPSMIIQNEEYATSDVNETFLNLTEKPASELTDDDKQQILKLFFICNEQNMILPYKRFAELFELGKSGDIGAFSMQDWLDLQIWYNLTWFGPISRQNPDLKYLFFKGENFSEDDKSLMLKVQKDILGKSITIMKRLQNAGNIEISVSPMFHPILPLIINSDSALDAMPDKEVPVPAFRFPQDARWHLEEAVKVYRERFDRRPAGLWPSEGSVSDDVLSLAADVGFKWLVTDEQIMIKSFANSVDRLERFFPRRFVTSKGDITVFFRDHLLSDLLGFSYANMEAGTAATDFINRLKYVRWEISSHYGEDSLNYAVVPVVLDGENCWEFYKDNGKPFLDALYSQLSNDEQLETVTFSEAAENSTNFVPTMNHIHSGSWINANFDIWIGQKEHIIAWNALRDARQAIENSSLNDNDENFLKAMEQIHIAEGSDWFWWYHDAHQAPNKNDFDIMYRELLKNVYLYLGEEYPAYLNQPFGKAEKEILLRQPLAKISPANDKIIESDWEKAGFYKASLAMDAMHSNADVLDCVYFANDSSTIYFRLDLKRKLKKDENIIMKIVEPFEDTILFNETLSDDEGVLFGSCNLRNADKIRMNITVKTEQGIIRYPRSGLLEIHLIK